MANPIIEAKNLKKIFNSLNVFQDINLIIESGKLYSIHGKSGAGKSTLLHLLGILDTPDSGEVIVNGTSINHLSTKEIALLRGENLGFVFQSYHLNNKMTAIENVMLPLYINPNYQYEEMEERASDLLKEVGLVNKEKHFPNELSGGENQRVAIARALANNPECILADEPTGSLDEDNENNIFEIFKNIVESGRTVVVISHNEKIKNYSDACYILDNGVLKEE
ncbi:ABC transporter ATP-binding protein [Pontibacillus yanchengensis]|uniref:ABC transporter ATP-binding protein n=1 Tax=Pontibacillus yanchengensis Y32 TaxID=1385514 RepID=A0A0A2T5F4_9BACI|nr:ABC transporter ATP-binding protein [Pontibacillus yanchengensis]KGP71022.1 ABC transporter ATP-binding protein [Pontibacillus yanchengensis Y32]